MFIKTEENKIIYASNWQADSSYKEVNFNYDNYIKKPQGYYIFDGKNIVENSQFEKEENERKKEKTAKLSLTKREVFLAIYKDKGLTPEDLKEQLKNYASDLSSENFDITSAFIEFDYANEYYRGNPLIEQIGNMIGYTKEQLDYLFEHKEFERSNN